MPTSRCPDAHIEIPRCPVTQMPRSPDAQTPRFPDAQVLTRQDTQVPRYLRIVKFFGWDFVQPKIEVGRNPTSESPTFLKLDGKRWTKTLENLVGRKTGWTDASHPTKRHYYVKLWHILRST